MFNAGSPAFAENVMANSSTMPNGNHGQESVSVIQQSPSTTDFTSELMKRLCISLIIHIFIAT